LTIPPGRDRAVRRLRALYVRSGVRERLPHSLKVRARGLWIRLARRIGYPIHSTLLTPPARPPRRGPLRLTHVLLACDLNPRYLDYWDLACRAWQRVAGLEPVLVLIAEADDVPHNLRDDERVRQFRPVPGLHTAFQAQCVRLLYPALLDVPGAVLVSDIDLMPMSSRYFHGPLETLDGSFFVSYRDVLLHRGELAICYNAAAPATWRDVFRVGDEAGVASTLRDWHDGVGYDGVRGGSGWFTDQLLLHDLLLSWGARTGRLWLLDDQVTGHRRLERLDLARHEGLSPTIRRDILRQTYTDFHSPVPYSRFRELEDEVIDLAIQAERRGRESVLAGARRRRILSGRPTSRVPRSR
jgi:hypothetical protein